MQGNPAYLDLDYIDTTLDDTNNKHWTNTQPIYIPSSPSSVTSLSIHSLGSTPDLSPTNLLVDSSTNTTSAPHLLLPQTSDTTNISTVVPLISTTLPIQSATSTTTQPIYTSILSNMNIPVNAVHGQPLYNMSMCRTKLASKTFKGATTKLQSLFVTITNYLINIK